MDKISNWWYIVGVICFACVFYTNESWAKGLLLIFVLMFIIRLIIHWIKNKYILYKTKKLCSAIYRCENVIDLNSVMKKFVRQSNSYVLNISLDAIKSQIAKVLCPIKYDNAICYGRKCYYKVSAEVWLNQQNQTAKRQVFIFNDTIDFIDSGHKSYYLSDIMNLNMEYIDQLCITIRNKTDGIYIKSDSAYLIYFIIKYLK